jgi:hypothetical protein
MRHAVAVAALKHIHIRPSPIRPSPSALPRPLPRPLRRTGAGGLITALASSTLICFLAVRLLMAAS